MKREYYSDNISNFIKTDTTTILGKLLENSDFAVEQSQRNAWIDEIIVLKKQVSTYQGFISFEYSIPRMGKRIDVLMLIGSVVFVVEFKAGEKIFVQSSVDQVQDYALDLKNFHETSHDCFIAPILIATKAKHINPIIALSQKNDKIFFPINCCPEVFKDAIGGVLALADDKDINVEFWRKGRYSPTPTIIEAATSLYKGHSVEDISRNDAEAINLSKTSATISEIINTSNKSKTKSICFVTGVPGAGKTLVGLNIANKHTDKSNDLYSVFLSGNGPLVAVLREALTRDKLNDDKSRGIKTKKSEIMSSVKQFIQNVHNFRDECLVDKKPPPEHVALFDEAQRAWDLDQTSNFMRRKKRVSNFNQSEPEFLISCLNRHKDWAVIVCFVGGGQEINTGEAGIIEWVNSLARSFPDWCIYTPPQLYEREYGVDDMLKRMASKRRVFKRNELHLSVSMRSFRAENVSLLVKQLLDLEAKEAKSTFLTLKDRYPIVITRDLNKAKHWLKSQARGSERYGIVVSSQAERLRPQAINVKSPMNPIHWFLNEKKDVRSSYYLEDVATEFHIQGLELDWACITWDADFRYSDKGWEQMSFRGTRWNRIMKKERQRYQKNAYRVLLTRARQGMVIVVPYGDHQDHTRKPVFYDQTYEYLRNIGFDEI